MRHYKQPTIIELPGREQPPPPPFPAWLTSYMEVQSEDSPLTRAALDLGCSSTFQLHASPFPWVQRYSRVGRLRKPSSVIILHILAHVSAVMHNASR